MKVKHFSVNCLPQENPTTTTSANLVVKSEPLYLIVTSVADKLGSHLISAESVPVVVTVDEEQCVSVSFSLA